MKNALPYIFLGLAAVLLALLLISSSGRNKERKLDERITLRMKDKIPYGTYVAHRLLPHMFPKADVYYDKKSPGNWDSVSATATNQAVFIVAREMDADEYELNRMLSFARNGNYVFILARYLSEDASRFFRCHVNENYFFVDDQNDSLRVTLEPSSFAAANEYVYPGKKYESYFSEIDTPRTQVLGRGSTNGVNFIRLQTGSGAIFIHIAPLAFSNYFLLHKQNIDYYKNALSVIPAQTTKVLWNDYYLTKPRFNNEKEKSWFRVLFQYPSLRAGLLTAMLTLALFVLLGMRRRQRMIPEWERPRNESLDFVKTIGRLYFDKGDHKNLAKKMGAYFLEHIRSHYKLPTHTLDEQFVEAVHAKSGYPVAEVKRITDFISFVETAPAISEKQLADFHKQLELFYQNT